MIGRPGGFASGEMRDKITIKKASLTANTVGESVRTWTDQYIDQPAKWMPTAGQETIRGRSVEAGIVAVFTMRRRDGITPQMRVVHSSGAYGIGYVKPVDGRRQYIELHCKQAVA